MLRKSMLALAAIAALGLTAGLSTTDAEAKKGWGKGWGKGGWHHKHKHGHKGWHFGRGFRFHVPVYDPDCYKVRRHGRIRIVCHY